MDGAEEAESAAWAARPDRRSYLLGIRPQNSLSSSRFSPSSLGRSTFCAIISQLTEETQPLFETTIKSRAVSEDSDAKFTCIVTGYPQPEVTWYKDDEEMDRYCGLPKYEIFRHGNRHTLQLYKCREEDAGIYQASARNNKGIVTCSGVLEVGTMTEFKIHQKWFDKIKRKAEAKLREIEQGKKRGKENVEVEKLQGMSPDRLQRKRRLGRDLNLRSGASPWEKEDAAKVHVADSQSRLREDIAEPKEQPGFTNTLMAPLKAEVTTNGDASLEGVEENGYSFLAYIYETVEDLAGKQMAKDSAAKKKKKVEAPPAAKKEVSKREEIGRERASPSPNARFAPPVPLHRSARLRAASDQEVESSPQIKEPGKTVNQDVKINGDVHFSLREMYFDNEVKLAAGQGEAGAKEEAADGAVSRQTEAAPSSAEVSEAAPMPSMGQRGHHQAQEAEGNKAVSPEVAETVGQSAGDPKHPVSAPAVEMGQQAKKNYLLLLLKMSDSGKDATKEDADPRDEEQPDAELALPEIGIAGLSPRTSRRVLEKVQNNQLFQTAENLPLTPRTSRRITGMINEEFISSKEMLAARPVPPKRRSRVAPEAEGPPQLSVPAIVVGSVPAAGAGQPPQSISNFPAVGPEKESPGDPLAALPCATPEELASGARRKIYLPKTKQMGEEEEATPESPGHLRKQRSPALGRKMATLEVPKLYEEPTGDSAGDHEGPEDAKSEAQPAESKKANNPFKAPQVIRKIRAEQFSDASGHLKLWCQFFNILSDSKLMWYKDEIPVAEAQRSAGDEGQAALAVVQASQKDCGVYRCVISNEYGTDATDFLLSPEVLSGFILREEIEVGEEIEMTPMVFAKGLADSGYWGDKLFGRVVSEDMEVGAGFLRKACRARAIYGLEPVFESGRTCVIKVHNFIVFGTKNENSLIEKNYDITIQECKIQNSSREYCKIFAAEARAVPDFGAVPEIIPLYLIYRPSNNIPYATMEEDLGGPCEQYCVTERDGSLVARGTSEIILKCCTFQHWVYQWTNGNILVTDMEGVGWKMTNVRIATNLKGYQGLKESCFPSLLEQFATAHQCNRYCSILGLKPLEPPKPKGSKSPSMGRKSAQSSPQLQKKGLASPQGTRKAAVSPKSSRRAAEMGEAPAASKPSSGESVESGHPQ
ncbi:alpha-protein kinase 3 [Patagioenas fasciata monilis]|uniref:Alpha-protein kinase 3 n=1 Tax=Patagioenas fasciata monilis TaxID=372326 RepID=A0A1V4KEE3_PATFA|nr:alpha-protein kinase 3 [Patagioenas fasciata monilis]